MEKAEKAAERKAAKRRLKKHTEPPSRFGKGRPGPPSAAPVPVGGPSLQMTAALRHPGPVPVLRTVGPCLACGEVGHLRSYCPKITAAARKWYPFEQVPHVARTAVVAGDAEGYDFGQGECGMVSVGPGTVVGRDAIGDVTKPEIKVQCWETEDRCLAEDTLVAPICVKGRLKASLQYWKKELEAPGLVLETIANGYVLPLMSEPAPYAHRN